VELEALKRHNLALAEADSTPRKCYRLRLYDGTVIRSPESVVLSGCASRRTSMVQVKSSDRRLRRNRTIQGFEAVTYGLVLHFLVCREYSGLVARAYVQNVTSRRDPAGGYGLHEELRGMHVLFSDEGMHRYTYTLSIPNSVGPMERDGPDPVLFMLEPFSRVED